MSIPIQLGSMVPDRQDTNGEGGVEVVQNLAKVADGYQSIPRWADSNRGTLDAECSGAWSGRTEDGQNLAVAGTATKLWLATTGDLTDESGAVYTLGADARWEFGLFGNFLLATNYSDDVQVFDLGTSPATFGQLSADASRCKYMAVIDQFLMLGNIVGRGVNAGAIGTRESGLHWSARGDHANYPQVGTDAAATVLSDWDKFPEDGGQITGLTSGSQWGLVLRERQVRRAEFVGGLDVFDFGEIVDEKRGCIVPGAAISVGPWTYYPSQEGFIACDGSRCVPIGHEKIDRYWRSMVNMARRFRVSKAHSSELRSVFWLFPDDDFLIAYNYELDDWYTLVGSGYEWLLSVLPLDTSMDDAPYATMDMDVNLPTGLGDQNMDELSAASVAELGAFNTAHKLGTFTSSLKQVGYIQTLFHGGEGRNLMRWIRPHFNGSGAVIGAVLSKYDADDGSPRTTIVKSVNGVGVIPARIGGRWHQANFITTGEIESFRHFDAEFSPQGRR
jgi:hypothetical protein